MIGINYTNPTCIAIPSYRNKGYSYLNMNINYIQRFIQQYCNLLAQMLALNITYILHSGNLNFQPCILDLGSFCYLFTILSTKRDKIHRNICETTIFFFKLKLLELYYKCFSNVFTFIVWVMQETAFFTVLFCFWSNTK